MMKLNFDFVDSKCHYFKVVEESPESEILKKWPTLQLVCRYQKQTNKKFSCVFMPWQIQSYMLALLKWTARIRCSSLVCVHKVFWNNKKNMPPFKNKKKVKGGHVFSLLGPVARKLVENLLFTGPLSPWYKTLTMSLRRRWNLWI